MSRKPETFVHWQLSVPTAVSHISSIFPIGSAPGLFQSHRPAAEEEVHVRMAWPEAVWSVVNGGEDHDGVLDDGRNRCVFVLDILDCRAVLLT
jgi:hypothetical protein